MISNNSAALSGEPRVELAVAYEAGGGRSTRGAAALVRDVRNELNDYLDSENLADLVGTTIAYSAYASLPPKYKRVALAGYDMSTERLFFVNHCVKWCAQHSQLSNRYAPFRSRCIVPLMNMPEFSNAFGCAAGTPMNPRKKCKFW
ncbi:hypothetical protein HPB50_019133 [Hyalomma asiaticum]|uniref:Uncharacterized protein n=1 Tax=Hyalomma asiaticum TaxID=266040 RepID=A0ACB7SIS5_HYAAI|nr:hypothetical protein HPB50_019133 [Hyalomma asiaticum]